MIVIFRQMLQQMTEDGFRRISFGIQSMGMRTVHGTVHDMAEQLFTQFLQQIILCLKMCIKGTAADICKVNDLLHRDIFKSLSLQQAAECLENRCSCLLLTSVHPVPSRTNLPKCMISYILWFLILAHNPSCAYNNIKQIVCYQIYCMESVFPCQA